MLLTAISSKIVLICGGVALIAAAFVVFIIIARSKNDTDATPEHDNIERIVDEQAKKKRAASSDSTAAESVAANEPSVAEASSKEKERSRTAAHKPENEKKEQPKKEHDNKAAPQGTTHSNTQHRQQSEADEHKRELSAEALTRYRVIYDKETKTWVIKKDGAKRVIRRLKTKEEAIKVAKDLSKNQDTAFIVHKKDGKFQKK